MRIVDDQKDYNASSVHANGDKKKGENAKSNAEEEKHNNLRGAGPNDEIPSIFSRGGMYFDDHQ